MSAQDYETYLVDMYQMFEKRGWNEDARTDYMTARAVLDHARKSGDTRQAPRDMQNGSPKYAELQRQAAEIVRNKERRRSR